MIDATHDTTNRFRRTVVQTLGACLRAVALVAVGGFTTAGGNEDRRENGAPSVPSSEGPLYIHGPTTRYQAIDGSPPGMFGELENVSEKTVWLARLTAMFYAENGHHVGTRAWYFLRIRPGQTREVALPFTDESFDDRSVILASDVLETILGGGRTVAQRMNSEDDQ